MRQIAIIILIGGILTSCGQREKELEQQLAELQELSSKKDRDIDAFITSMTNIQMNLDSVKELEGIITARAISDSENGSKAEDEIVEDMMLIYNSMERTRDQLEAMEEQLEESSIATEKLKRFVTRLKKDLAQKEKEITGLKQGLTEANIYIDKLMSSVDRLALENERRVKVIQKKNLELQEKEAELQTGYWITGTTKDLRARNIIDREGAFLGMGGIKVVSEDMSLEDLEQVNILDVTEIAIDAKKAEIVTSHPKHTYEFVGNNKKVEKLMIDDPEAFWQNSKVLVIITN